MTEPTPLIGAEPAEPVTVGELPPRRAPVRVVDYTPPPEREEFWALSWAKAIWGGIQDTSKDVLDAGRKGASEAYDEGWTRFDNKTRFRRQIESATKKRKKRR